MRRPRQPIAINIDKILAEGGREQVGVAHKARHKARRGLAIKLLRRADLHDMPLVHHQHGIGNRKGFALIVGHVQRGDIKLLLQFADLIAHAAPQVGVEVTQRLVKQQHLRLEDQGARQRHALLLAAGDLIDIAVFESFQIDHRQRLFHPRFHVAARHAKHFQAVADVIPQRHMREQGVRLKHHTDIALLNGAMGDVFTVDVNLPFARFFQPGHQAQDGGLAAAGRAEQRHHLPLRDGEVDIVDNHVAAESLGDVAQLNKIFLTHRALHYAWFLAFEREIRASPISQSKRKIIASITTIRIDP